MINDVVDMAEFAMDRFENEYDDIELLEQAAPANLVNLEALLANDPKNYRMLVFLSKVYFSYAYALGEVEWESALFQIQKNKVNGKCPSLRDTEELRLRVSRHYSKGIYYALKAMAVNHPDCDESLQNVNTAADFIKSLGKGDVPALFWYGMNLSAYININQDSVKAVSKLNLAIKAMDQVLKLDPTYYYGCAHLTLMTVYSSIPVMLGGNPERSQYHYQEQKKITGDDFLLVDLHYARYYLYQKQDLAEYHRVLNRIIQQSRQNTGRYMLFNQIAANRAAIYLDAADRLFN